MHIWISWKNSRGGLTRLKFWSPAIKIICNKKVQNSDFVSAALHGENGSKSEKWDFLLFFLQFLLRDSSKPQWIRKWKWPNEWRGWQFGEFSYAMMVNTFPLQHPLCMFLWVGHLVSLRPNLKILWSQWVKPGMMRMKMLMRMRVLMRMLRIRMGMRMMMGMKPLPGSVRGSWIVVSCKVGPSVQKALAHAPAHHRLISVHKNKALWWYGWVLNLRVGWSIQLLTVLIIIIINISKHPKGTPSLPYSPSSYWKEYSISKWKGRQV